MVANGAARLLRADDTTTLKSLEFFLGTAMVGYCELKEGERHGGALSRVKQIIRFSLQKDNCSRVWG